MKEEAVDLAHESHVMDVLFSKSGDTLLSAGMDNKIKLWFVPSWEAMATFEGHENSVNSLTLSVDDKLLATSSSDMTVKLWIYPSGDILKSMGDINSLLYLRPFHPIQTTSLRVRTMLR